MSEKSKTLKELLADFDAIVTWFDQGEDLDVEEAISRYEKGAELAAIIEKQLKQAKNKIEVVNKNETDL
ncbi:exodeoxyribonuclease VII small subunit [Candidatus Saccharibacteria bacterium]|nr:exodeoxyribonuclease VII small subunit [Candidatus Saccharibacteria bacterium]